MLIRKYNGVAFFQKGVMIIPATTNKFKYMGYKSSAHNVIGSNCVMSVYKDHTGTLWVGTGQQQDIIHCPRQYTESTLCPHKLPHIYLPATRTWLFFEDCN